MNRSSTVLTVIAVILALLVVSALIGLAGRLIELAPVIAVIAIAYVLLHRPTNPRAGMSIGSSLVAGTIIGIAAVGLWLVLAGLVVRLIVLGLVIAAAFVVGQRIQRS